MQREQKVDFEPVGTVSQPQLGPAGATDALASRLRPLDNSATIQPIWAIDRSTFRPRLASSTVSSSYGESTEVRPKRACDRPTSRR